MLLALGVRSPAQNRADVMDSVSLNNRIDPSNIDWELLKKGIQHETNRIRMRFELDSLLPDNLLDSAASLHARYLSTHQKLGHINLEEPKLRTPYSRIRSTGTEIIAVAENLARTNIYKLGKNGRFFVDENGKIVDENGKPVVTLTYLELARELVQGWLNSDGHRDNLLGPYTHHGLAGRKMERGNKVLTEIVLVHNFGKY